MKQTITVLGSPIQFLKHKQEDFISLTDIAKYKDPERSDYIIQNWMRSKYSIEFLGLRESMYNPVFNSIEFDGIKNQAGANSFSMTPKRWIDTTNAIGLVTKTGRYWGWTFAHKDIALEFASWISVEIKLYLIKEFQRLKEQEQGNLDRTVKRFITKMNYKIHTDAIKQTLIPKLLSPREINYIYADEADILNVALFGITAKQRRERQPEKWWNIRDEATISQLIVLANLESINAEFIKMNMGQAERIQLLNKIAIEQMHSLEDGCNFPSHPYS